MKKLLISNISFFVILIFLITTCSSSGNNENQNQENGIEATNLEITSNLFSELNKFKNDPLLKNAAWGFVVVDVETGKTVISHNPDLSLVPASTLKLLTTVSALQILGPDYRYKTALGYTGEIGPKGTLEGNLVIKGSGDPTFGSSEIKGALKLEEIFESWIKALKNKGINKVNGQVIADESVFDFELIPRQWIWEDMGNYFGAGSSGLSVNENMYTVYFQPGNTVGSAARVLSTDPVVPEMALVNLVTTGPRNSGDQVYIFGAPYQNQRTLTGTVPLGSNNFPVKGSIPDPPMFVARAFHDYLTSNGIEILKQPTNQRIRNLQGLAPPVISQEIAKYTSPAMSEIASRTNIRSVNTLAENLLKTIGVKEKNEGSYKKGGEAVMEFWQKKGLDTDGMFIFDGSGLSPANRITAHQLAQIVVHALQHSSGRGFSDGLALAGKSGNLASLFKGTKSEGVLRAKSGFISNVRAYSGYTTTSTGKNLAFALIVNNFSGTNAAIRDKMVSLMDAITNY